MRDHSLTVYCTVEVQRLGRVELVGYDWFKLRKSSKILAVVDQSSIPLYLTIDPKNEHGSRRLQKLVDGLSGRPKRVLRFFADVRTTRRR
jgi:hypothetical protein